MYGDHSLEDGGSRVGLSRLQEIGAPSGERKWSHCDL